MTELSKCLENAISNSNVWRNKEISLKRKITILERKAKAASSFEEKDLIISELVLARKTFNLHMADRF